MRLSEAKLEIIEKIAEVRNDESLRLACREIRRLQVRVAKLAEQVRDLGGEPK